MSLRERIIWDCYTAKEKNADLFIHRNNLTFKIFRNKKLLFSFKPLTLRTF